jgi:hypothetical protein
MCLEMTFLDALARHRDSVKRNQHGGGIQNLYGPQCKGRPPGPNGQCGGGSKDPLPRYGPTSNTVTKPPGPNASLPS